MSQLAQRAGAAAALTATAIALAPAAQAAPPDDAIASAAYGPSQIWLQRKPSDPTRRELVFQESASAAPRVLDVAVPPRDAHMVSDWSENVALGLDGAGRLTAVVQSRRGLYWTGVTGTPRMHRVPATTGNDTVPSLFRGQVAYGRFVGETRSVVRLGTLRGHRARTMWTNRSDTQWRASQTAVGTGRAVAIVVHRDGAGNGADRVLLARPGRPARRLQDLGLGEVSEGGLSIAISPGGRRLTVTRTRDDSTTTTTYALPSGRVLGKQLRR